MTERLALAVSVDWDGDGEFTDAGGDVSARVLARPGVAVQRGRDQARQLSPPMAGSASLVLDNRSRD